MRKACALLVLLPAFAVGFQAPLAAFSRKYHLLPRHSGRVPAHLHSARAGLTNGALRLASSTASLDPDVFVKQSEVLAALSLVEDPSRGAPITTLGAVKELKIDKDSGSVSFNVELGAPDLKGAVKKQSEDTVSTLG